jgi:hypothetical protein
VHPEYRALGHSFKHLRFVVIRSNHFAWSLAPQRLFSAAASDHESWSGPQFALPHDIDYLTRPDQSKVDMDASNDGSESVDQFLARIASLSSKQNPDEAERSKRTEEELLQARKERQARRAGMATMYPCKVIC